MRLTDDLRDRLIWAIAQAIQALIEARDGYPPGNSFYKQGRLHTAYEELTNAINAVDIVVKE